jgi:hypothetical protein
MDFNKVVARSEFFPPSSVRHDLGGLASAALLLGAKATRVFYAYAFFSLSEVALHSVTLYMGNWEKNRASMIQSSSVFHMTQERGCSAIPQVGHVL